eukprot:CAMPEP_0119376624 /NCGR_PEP_ID=MMETSP1334-20130426/40344_1 /TAXON_ID=127549 /ORGANISM="Calcidiscus leptoporus, Strain RCC1130" /LENGTH=113 /DNA_ID=CAMNT_0007395227 /DNA_START=267 /DNA_END=608 /DNA_ORIENTATION=-
MSFRKSDAEVVAVPNVALTRSRDGSTGTATFCFDDAVVLSRNDVWENGLITGLWLSDQEGVLHTTDLSISWAEGQPKELTAILVLKNELEWARFMRFMERYAVKHELAFSGAK